MTGSSPLETAVSALRLRGDEPDDIDLLAELAALHIPAGVRCHGCRQEWPCAGWLVAHALAVELLGRAADRISHAW